MSQGSTHPANSIFLLLALLFLVAFFVLLLVFLFLLELDQVAATFFAAAMASVIFQFFLLELAVNGEFVIVGKFFAFGDVADCLNPDTVVLVLERFAVGIAGMVDPARFVAGAAAVDHSAVGEFKEKSMGRIVGIAGRQFESFVPTHPVAFVLDDRGSLFDVAGGEDAAPVNAGSFDAAKGRRGGGFLAALDGFRCLALGSSGGLGGFRCHDGSKEMKGVSQTDSQQ